MCSLSCKLVQLLFSPKLIFFPPPCQGEELTFDYNYVRVFGAAAKKCYCGSPRCRGYIGGGDPLDDEMIVQGDSDEEFPEPVMLTEDGEIEESEPEPRYFDNVDTKSSRHLLKDSDIYWTSLQLLKMQMVLPRKKVLRTLPLLPCCTAQLM